MDPRALSSFISQEYCAAVGNLSPFARPQPRLQKPSSKERHGCSTGTIERIPGTSHQPMSDTGVSCCRNIPSIEPDIYGQAISTAPSTAPATNIDPELLPSPSLDSSNVFAQDSVQYGIHDDVMLPEFLGQEESFVPEDVFFDKRTVTMGLMTTSNTYSDAITPDINTVSPFTPFPPSWDGDDTTALSSSGQQASILDFDPGHWLSENDLCSAKRGCTNPILPEYPPLPELNDVPLDLTQDFEGFASGPEEGYLPAWYVETQALAPHGSGFETSWRTPVSEVMFASPTESGQAEPKSCQRDTSKDVFLLRGKAQGMSYRQIKELGKFEEAESTLRGRYRALTKPREARLRKPEWGEREIQLLFEGVSHCSKSTAGASKPGKELDAISMGQFANKIPWKQVAEYMEGKGAYRYGNATVKKKYLEILRERQISVRTKAP